jgi:PAS domain S-box-containing protein
MIKVRISRIAPVAIPALAIGIFALDLLTPRGVVDWVLYFVPLLLSFYGNGRFSPFRLAAVFSVLTAVGFYVSPPSAELGIELFNLLLGITTLWAVAAMVAKLRRATDETRKLEQAVKQSPASIVITDVSGIIAYVNPKFTEVTGYSLDEVAGKNPRILKGGETPPEEYKALWDTISAGKEWRGTLRNRKKNGEFYRALTSIAPIVDEAGKCTYFLRVSEDITEQNRVQEELMWKTAFLEAQVNSSLDGILVVDSQHKKYCKISGLMNCFVLPKILRMRTTTQRCLNTRSVRSKTPSSSSNGLNTCTRTRMRLAGMKLNCSTERFWIATPHLSGTRRGSIMEESGRFATSANA